jgi:hypothetical protein
VGDMLSAQGAPGAASNYAEALGIARQFANSHPASVPGVRTVAVLMVKLAAIPATGVARADVVAYLEAAQAKGMLSADDQRWLAAYREQAVGQAQGGAK